MPELRKRMSNEEFYRRLDALRAKIDSVPEEHRAAIRAEADEARERHERMRRTRAAIDDMVADMGLIVERTVFYLAACRRELRELDPAGRFQIQAHRKQSTNRTVSE